MQWLRCLVGSDHEDPFDRVAGAKRGRALPEEDYVPGCLRPPRRLLDQAGWEGAIPGLRFPTVEGRILETDSQLSGSALKMGGHVVPDRASIDTEIGDHPFF